MDCRDLMKRMPWIVLPCLLAGGCDESEAPVAGTTGTPETTGAPETTGGAEGESSATYGCSDGGPPTVLRLDLGETPLPSGTYRFELFDEFGGSVDGCTLSLPDGSGCQYAEADGRGRLTLFPSAQALQAPMQLVVTAGEATLIDETQQFEYEALGGRCWSYGEGEGAIDLGAAQCSALQVAFDAEVEVVRGCEEASECGTVIPGFSCGCTRDWVGRLDADATTLSEIAQAAVDGECEWAVWESSCDCPETDGFACVENTCTWSYVQE